MESLAIVAVEMAVLTEAALPSECWGRGGGGIGAMKWVGETTVATKLLTLQQDP